MKMSFKQEMDTGEPSLTGQNITATQGSRRASRQQWSQDVSASEKMKQASVCKDSRYSSSRRAEGIYYLNFKGP